MKRIAIVTGANTGLGYETTLGLVKADYKVVMACRTRERANKARENILKEIPRAELDVILLDLSNLDLVRRFAQEYAKNYRQLDILVNNAGIMRTPYHKTEEGFEEQFVTNYLGHFLLTSLLIAFMPDSDQSRIVSLSSIAHKRGKINFEDLASQKHYSPTKAYCQSKVACLIYAQELNRRLQNKDRKILSVAAHPGIAITELIRHMTIPALVEKLLRVTFVPLFTHLVPQAALPTLHAAMGDNVKGGDYFGPQDFFETKGLPGVAKKSAYSQDEEIAQRLWDVSEKLIGQSFDVV